MTENSESIFSTGFDDIQVVKRRWLLLPWWIRAFALLFLLAGLLTPFIVIAGFLRIPIMLNLYGFSSTVPLSYVGLSIVALYVLKGLAAWGLWAQKDWGITVAMIDGLIGVVVCIANMFVAEHATHGFSFYFRLDIIVLVIYLIKLYRTQELWNRSGK